VRCGRQGGRRARAAALGLALALSLASAAEGQHAVRRVGVITLRGCARWSEADVRSALDAELRGMGEADGAPLEVVLECAGVAAVVVSLRGSSQPPRALDVSDVPPRLHARLVALAIAEMLLVGAQELAPAEPAPEPRATPEPAPEPSASAPSVAESSGPPERASEPSAPAPSARVALSPEPAPELEPAPEPRPSLASALGAPGERTRVGRGALTRIALDATRPHPPLVGVSARGLLRVFADGGAVLGGGEALVRIGPVALGAHVSAAPDHADRLGVLLPSLVLGVAELSLVCLDHALVELCASVHAGAGRAAVDARALREGITAQSLEAPYVEGALALSVALVHGPLVAALELRGGWAEGLVALSDERSALGLAGPVLDVLLSVEVLP
jgi:hypothetical protein